LRRLGNIAVMHLNLEEDSCLESGCGGQEVEARMNVQSVMEKNVKFSGVQDSLADVARVMGENDCGAVPIVDENKKVVGMVTDRDICLAMAAAERLPSRIPVREVMAKKVFSCGPSDEIGDALQVMQKNKVRRLPVLDDGKLTGILSMDDVILHTESRRGKPAEIGYGDAVRTLKAIYRRTPQKKGAVPPA
jgi:CBS domain-containing protein